MANGEESFKVSRVSSHTRIQEVHLTLTDIEGKPALKLKYYRLNRYTNKTFDISGALKLFHSISNQRPYSFKILSNNSKKNLDFFCRDKETYDQCVKQINEALANYHKKKGVTQDMNATSGNMDSIKKDVTQDMNATSGNMDRIVEEESDYMTMKSPVKEKVDNEPVNLRKKPSKRIENEVDYVYQTIHDASIEQRTSPEMLRLKAFESDYEIPEFKYLAQPLTIPRSTPFWRVSMEMPSDFNKNIIEVLKLKEEIGRPGGVEIDMDDICNTKIRVVEFEEALWVSKIVTKNDSFSHLHVGDRIFAANKTIIKKASEFEECCKSGKIIIRIIRLPKAKVFAVENEMLKNYLKKDLVFCNQELDKNEKDKWILTEINSMTNLDTRSVNNLINTNPDTHFVVIHQKSFIGHLKSTRRSSIFNR